MAKNAFEEIVRCRDDAPYFIEKYVKIQHPTKGKIPLTLYPFQKQSIIDFVDHRFNVVLKSRQLGYSTVTSAYALWVAMFYENQAIIVVATNLATAKLFFKKVKYAWQNLPPVFKKLVNEVSSTQQEISFTNGSSIKAVPTGDSVARGEALSILIVDEAAFIPNFDVVYQQAYPTLSTGGRMVVLSTPGDIGNQYHQIWEGAISKKNDFHPTELPWNVHPDRDEAWRLKTIRDMGIKKFEVEYNCSFEGASKTYFSIDLIEKIKDNATLPERIGSDNQELIWDEPREDGKYVLAVDVARGDGGDYSTSVVIDVETGMVCYEDRRHENPQDYARRCIETAKYYNNALIAPEANTFGFMFICTLRDEKYKNVYFDLISNWENAQENNFNPARAGFKTTESSKQQALVKLDDYLTTGRITALSSRLPEEMLTFVEKETKGGKLTYGAVRGKYDDLVMCYAIAAYVVYQVVDGNHGICLNIDDSNVVSTNYSPVAGTQSGLTKVKENTLLSCATSGGISVLKNSRNNKFTNSTRQAIMQEILNGKV